MARMASSGERLSRDRPPFDRGKRRIIRRQLRDMMVDGVVLKSDLEIGRHPVRFWTNAIEESAMRRPGFKHAKKKQKTCPVPHGFHTN